MNVKINKILFCLSIVIFSYIFPVYADDEDFEILSDISYVNVSSEINAEPSINSRSAIIYERSSSTILYRKNENKKVKMASTTKIMTAIIVIEKSNLDDIVTISRKAAGTGGSRLGLHAEDKISVHDLLYGLLLCSGNDAAVALAEYVGGDVFHFANLMNSKTSELGLTSTHFVTPHGLDNDDHYTTAYELALITNYALKNETFRKIVGTKHYNVSINGYSKNLSNTNELLGNLDGVYGVKTGFTNGANRCLVTSVKRNNMDLICIVLGADTKKDRTKDSCQLIEYAFQNYKMVDIKEKITNEFANWKICNSASFIVEKGVSNSVDVVLEDLQYNFLPVNCNLINDISIYIYCNTTFKAPLPANTSIGYITVCVDNKTLLTLNIYNSNYIPSKGYLNFFDTIIKNYTYHLEALFY